MRIARQRSHQISETQGISAPQLSVLLYMLEAGSLKIGQIQAYLHKSPSTASALVDQLQEKGYVNRERSEEDQRIVIVTLTDAGHKMALETALEGLPRLRVELRKVKDRFNGFS